MGFNGWLKPVLNKFNSLRQRLNHRLARQMMIFVGGLVLLSLFGSTLSLFRITEVNQLLDVINRDAVPLSRLLTQIQSDTEVFVREAERNLGFTHWGENRWKPRPIPRWIQEILSAEIERMSQKMTEMIERHPALNTLGTTKDSEQSWRDWAREMELSYQQLLIDGLKLYQALEKNDMTAAAEVYPRWKSLMEDWRRRIQWGVLEYDRTLRQAFTLAESRVRQLQTGLEVMLIVVVLLSLLLLWLGERALRPLARLTAIAREITRRGLRKEDKAFFPDISLNRQDEVSQLAQEFYRMATALLEREKIVDHQKNQLYEQNRLLRTMGQLNENILRSIRSLLIVTDPYGKITQCNPVAREWLARSRGNLSGEGVIGSSLFEWERLKPLLESDPNLKKMDFKNGPAWVKVEPCRLGERIYGGHLMSLTNELKESQGMVLVLDDLTDELDLQERLHRAENMAAIGRMSAQVAHEIRNPLHSIGLEAEMALDLIPTQATAEESAEKLIVNRTRLNQSLASILASVDRLEKIIQNYLQLSKLSSGRREWVDLGEVLEAVLATYAPLCEAARIPVEWHLPPQLDLRVWADRDLLEQALGNLFKNAIQAIQQVTLDGLNPRRIIRWTLQESDDVSVESLLIRIEDQGPGLPQEVKEKLFIPFVTTKPQGTGLGLSFAKKVFEDHGGEVRYYLPEPGVGTGFEIRIPRGESETVEKFQVDRNLHGENIISR